MKNRLIKTFLILVILSPLIYSLSFAQEELANEIIEEKIDELWTTGKLKISNANIASKNWLPALYERNGFELLLQNPQNVTVMLVYMTVSVDENGNFIFKKDIYERDRPVLEGLNEEFAIWQTRAIK